MEVESQNVTYRFDKNVGDASFVHILVYFWTERNTKGCFLKAFLFNGKWKGGVQCHGLRSFPFEQFVT